MQEYREFSAKTVDEAITKAMEELETSSDMLDYEVVEAGSSGILGLFGARKAVIRARRKEDEPEISFTAEKKTEKRPESRPEVKKEAPKKEEKKEEPRREEPKKEAPRKEAPKKEETRKEAAPAPAQEAKAEEPKKEVVCTPEDEKAATEFLAGVFGAMGLNVEMHTAFNSEEESLEIDLSGDDMGILIGKRGQTLDSLQYLTSLVVNKGRGDYLRVKLDTENYRERRKETLENLARNISFKVRKSHRSVALEPMNPYERRVIHSALQSDKFVTTRSEGEEPFRHVVVVPKKDRPDRPDRRRGGRYHNNRREKNEE